MKKKRLVVFLIVFSFLTVNVTAQTGFSGETNPIGDIFQQINNQIKWYEGGGIGSFILWIVVPALGMYAIFRFIYGKAFEFAEENFRENSGIGSSGMSDMADSMSKLLAASTSIVALVFWGGLLGWAMVIAGIAGIAWFAWANASGFIGTTSPLPFGDNTTSDNSNIDDKFEEMKNELRDEFEREEDIKKKISRLRGEGAKFDEAVDELESSNLPDGVKSDLERIKNEWHDEQEKEYTLAEVLDEIASEEQSEIQEEMEIEELEQYIERELSHLVNLDRDMDQRLDQMRSELEEMKRREEQDGLTPELRQELDRFHDQLGQTRAEVNEAIREAEDAKDAAERAREMYEELDQEIQETRERFQEAEEEDTEVTSEAEDEEEKLSGIEEQTEALRKDRERYKAAMEEIHNSVGMEEAIAGEEDTEIREEVDEMTEIEREKEHIKDLIKGDNSKIAEVAQDLKEKTDEIEEMEEEWEALTGAAERAEMEEEEFIEALEEKGNEIAKIVDSVNTKDDFDLDLIAALETELEEIRGLGSRMPPEVSKNNINMIQMNIQHELEKLNSRVEDWMERDGGWRIDKVQAHDELKEMIDEFPLLTQNGSGGDKIKGS